MAMTRTSSARPGSGMLPWAALVGLGGTVGTLARTALETMHPAGAGSFPWTTWMINMVGSFLLGVLQESLALSGDDVGWRRAARIGIGTGVIGGFTTYSTFVLESDRLLGGPESDIVVGLVYVVGSVTLGLVCAMLGIQSAKSAVTTLRRDRPEDEVLADVAPVDEVVAESAEDEGRS